MIVFFLLICSLTINIFAAGPLNQETGSISVTMEYEGHAVSGGSLTLYHVAIPVWQNEDYVFEFTQSFAQCTLSLEDLDNQQAANHYAEYVFANRIDGVTKTIDANGKVCFENLELGLYLLMQRDAAEGYFEAAPFLVSVPMNGEEDWIYDVDASPKVDLDKEPEPTTPTTPPTPPDIPQTGQLKWPIPVLIVAGLAIFILGWALCFRKKKEKDET